MAFLPLDNGFQDLVDDNYLTQELASYFEFFLLKRILLCSPLIFGVFSSEENQICLALISIEKDITTHYKDLYLPRIRNQEN